MKVNVKTGEAEINGKVYRLTRYEIRALEELSKPGIRTFEDIYKAVYKVEPKNLTKADIKILHVLIFRIRRKTNIKINGVRQFGYELERSTNEQV